jgi:hypothetical protein
MGGGGRAKRAMPTHDDGAVMNGAPGFCVDGGSFWVGIGKGGSGRAKRAMPTHDDGAVMNGAPGSHLRIEIWVTRILRGRREFSGWGESGLRGWLGRLGGQGGRGGRRGLRRR